MTSSSWSIRSRISGVTSSYRSAAPSVDELAQIRVAIESRRRLEPGQVISLVGRGPVSVHEVELDALGDVEGVVADLGSLGEDLPHLLRALQVELVGVELQSLQIGLHLLLLDAEQHVVRLRVLLERVVQVVRGDDPDAEVTAEVELVSQDLALVADAVVLHLDEVVVGAEDVAVLGGRRAGAIGLPVEQLDRDLARQAARQAGDALGMLGHELLVHARPVVEALEIGGGDELQQVAIAGLVPSEQGEVVVLLLALSGVAIEPRSRRHVGLDPDDGLDARGPRDLEELQRPEHRAVIGDGDRGHAEALRLGEDRRRPGVRRRRLDAGGTVEQGVLGVGVEMDEAVAALGHVRCAISLREGYPQRAGALWRTTPV